MTAITHDASARQRTLGGRHLAIALLIGAVGGSVATLAFVNVLDGAAHTVSDSAAVSTTPLAHDAATAQYVGWYTRSPIGVLAWAAETEQYTAYWYDRAADLAGSTTATEQYVSWYLRDE